MKFAIAIVATFLVLEANSFVVPEQEQAVEAENSFKNLDRVKRGCSCGPYGCSCSLIDPDEPQELKRTKRGCFCGPNGCGCTLREPEENEELQRSKRSIYDEEISAERLPEEYKRSKRGCSCGPYGCSCTLTETDESFLKAVGADQLPEFKRSKRGGCFCGPNGCGCTLREPEESHEHSEEIERSKRSADVESLAVAGQPAELKRSKRGCSCGPYGCSCSLRDTNDIFF